MKKVRVFDFRKCASTDETKYWMTGVYHDKGYKVATDGRMLAKIKSDYPEMYEGKIMAFDGDEIKGDFPKYERVIPHDKDLVKVDCPSVELLDAARKMPGHVVNLAGRFIIPKYWGIVYNFVEVFGEAEMFIAKKEPERKAVVFKNNDNMLVIMPCEEPTYTIFEGKAGLLATAPESKPEPVKYRCDGDNQAKYLKVTYKQLKDIGHPVLTVGKGFLLSGLDPMCLTWGKNGWDVKVYDMANLLITAGDGANGIHIPAEIVKKYQDGLQDGDDYRAVIDRFLDEVDTWYKARNVA